MTPCPKPQRRPRKLRKAMSRSRIKRKPPRRLKGPGADPAFIRWCHENEACPGVNGLLLVGGLLYAHVCEGNAEFMHFRDMTGLGLKEGDATGFLGCSLLHRQYDHPDCLPFLPLSKAERKAWFRWHALAAQTRRAAEQIQGAGA